MRPAGIEDLIYAIIDDIAAPGVKCHVINNGTLSSLIIRLTKITYHQNKLPTTKMIQFPTQDYKDNPNNQWSGIPTYIASHIYTSDPNFLNADTQAIIRNSRP